MSTISCSSAEIIRHTSAFLSEILHNPDSRKLFSAFLHRIPSSLNKSLTSISVRCSSLRLAKKFLLSIDPDNPFSPFLSSLVSYLRHHPIDAALNLLHVFYVHPSSARLDFAPYLFQELFLVHFQPLQEWYNMQRSNILSSCHELMLNPDDSYIESNQDQSIVSNTTLLSRISCDQASALKDLETHYQDLLDDNCRIFAEYFKQVVSNTDGFISFPSLLLQKREKISKSTDEICVDKGTTQEFHSTNRRYNPMWAEENNDGTKFPERVSPKILASHTFDDSLSDSSEAEQEERIRKTASFDLRRKKPISAEEFRQYMMEDIDSHSGGGKPQTPPKDFVCPITSHIFYDPVTLETGQTYERKAIQEWIDRGNSTCPITRHKLHSTNLPKTNYVLKRLIASWQENNPTTTRSHLKSSPELIGSVSPNSVISQANADGNMSELRIAITDLCTSEILVEAEAAILKIQKLWTELNTEIEIQAMLTKPAVVSGFVEVLFNSVDAQVLGAALMLLTELGSRDDSVIQTLTRVDSDVECIVELIKKGLVEAVVLVHLLRPSATKLVEMDIVDSLLATVVRENDHDFPKMCMKPRTASVILLGRILRDESVSEDVVRSILSRKAIEKIVVSLGCEQVQEERTAAVYILLACILEDGKCRNLIADKIELVPLLESFIGANDGERFEIVYFLSELVKLKRRNLNERILHIIKEEGSFSTMHTLLIYLQNAVHDQSAIVAGLLLQLDLLDEPRKMSIYREEAMDTLISCLRNSESPSAQISAAETLLSLQGRFSYSGKSLARAILLKRAGIDRSYKAFMRKDQRRENLSGEIQDTMEEKAAEEWEKKAAYVIVSHEFGLIFEAVAEGLKSRNEELCSICMMLATWLVYMLSTLPDTGILGAARACLLKQFVSIFKNEKNYEDRALSMLALNCFIHDPDGLQDVTPYMKDILKGLRELKKSSSSLAFQMLKVLSEEHDNSADLWNHKELSQEDCSINGEVLTLTCSRDKIFSGHSDGTIKVWTSRGSELRLLEEVQQHTKAVTSLAILHSSEKLYSGSLDKTLKVWLVTEEGIHCEQVIEMKDHINNLVVANSVACYIPQGAGVKVHSWNGSSKAVNQNKHAKCLALVQGKLYCGCFDNSIQEIDLVTGTVGNIQNGSKKLLGKANPINALQVNDGLIYAASSPFDGANVKIFNSSNYGLVGSLASTLEVRSMVVSSELIYLGCKGGIIEVWCKKKYNRVETLEATCTTKILCMAVDPNEDILVVGTSDGRIQMWGLS